MTYRLFISAAFLILALPLSASAHPGGTDSSGCHTCRTNCSNWGLYTGEYHCHNAKGTPQPEGPIHSVYGSGGTGYTTPAPEYEYTGSSDSHSPNPTSVVPNPPVTIPEPKPEPEKKAHVPVAERKQPAKVIEKKSEAKKQESPKKPLFAPIATTSTTTSLVTLHATPTPTTTNPAPPKTSFIAKLFQKMRWWRW